MRTIPVKLLYVHGYLGRGDCSSSQKVRAELEKRGIEFTLDAPDFPVTEPDKMKDILEKVSGEHKYDYIIASSLGAFYCMHLISPFLILINPAMPENLYRIRENEPGQHPKLTDEFLELLEKEKDYIFNICVPDDDDEVRFCSYFILGTKDDIADNRALIKRSYPESHISYVDMGHIVSEAGAEKVVDLIEKLEANPPVYIDQLSAVLADCMEVGLED